VSTALASQPHRLVTSPGRPAPLRPRQPRLTLYWADRNSRWHRYHDIDPGTADQLLDEINEDPTSIFWG
jgi:hypothetical protein